MMSRLVWLAIHRLTVPVSEKVEQLLFPVFGERQFVVRPSTPLSCLPFISNSSYLGIEPEVVSP